MNKANNVYLLAGPEAGDKNEFIKTIKEKLQKIAGTVDEYSFYPYDIAVSDIVSILRNIPLFASAKLVVIKNCNDIKKKDLPVLAEYVKTPADNTVLILVMDNFADSSIEKIVPAGCKKIFWEKSDNEKKGWIAQFFKKEKIPIDPGAIDFLADVFGANTEMLKRECFNLVLFFNENELITGDKIADFFYNRKDESNFSLFAAIANSDLPKAVEAANAIILSGESNPIDLLGSLLWQIRNLYEIKQFLVKEHNINDALLHFGITTKKQKPVYENAVKNYSIENIEKIISLTAYYNALFRSGKIKTELQNILFPVYIYSIIICKGRNFFRTDID
jgi:DNA polymerase-3 subunit delta